MAKCPLSLFLAVIDDIGSRWGACLRNVRRWNVGASSSRPKITHAKTPGHENPPPPTAMALVSLLNPADIPAPDPAGRCRNPPSSPAPPLPLTPAPALSLAGGGKGPIPSRLAGKFAASASASSSAAAAPAVADVTPATTTNQSEPALWCWISEASAFRPALLTAAPQC